MTIQDTQKKLLEIQSLVSEKLIEVELIERKLKTYEKNIEQLADFMSKKLGNNVDSQTVKDFFKKPYIAYPHTDTSILVFVPKIISDFQVGWLHKEDDTYYIYELNQYSTWLGDVPDDLLELINFKESIKGYVEGNRFNFDPNSKDILKKDFKKHLTDFTETSARIIQGHEFDIIAEMVDHGCLPFKPRKVLQSDLHKSNKIKLRDYQKDAYNKFLDTGAVGVFYPTGAGKSFIAMHCMETVKGKKLLVVPTITLKDQWEYYIETHIPEFRKDIEIITYHACNKVKNNDYALTIYDECQKLPANTFSTLAVINTKYRLGLSASPHREDKRESYIFALTGFPIGLNWKDYMNTVGRSYFPVEVIIVKHASQKPKTVEKLLDNKKTIIFCDSIELGKTLSNNLNIPHVYGETKNRVDIIKENNHTVVSRVGDLGLSIDDLERIIEVDFLFGSRQQELQRLGRLMHSNKKDLLHYIIMTEHEFESHKKRLWALREKGFNVRINSQ